MIRRHAAMHRTRNEVEATIKPEDKRVFARGAGGLALGLREPVVQVLSATSVEKPRVLRGREGFLPARQLHDSVCIDSSVGAGSQQECCEDSEHRDGELRRVRAQDDGYSCIALNDWALPWFLGARRRRRAPRDRGGVLLDIFVFRQ